MNLLEQLEAEHIAELGKTIPDFAPGDIERVTGTNLFSPFEMSRLAAPMMIAQGSGRIINIASIAALRFFGPDCVAYAAAKAGMVGFSKALAAEIASRGITVNCIAPGMINTAMTANLRLITHTTQRHTGIFSISRARNRTT